MTDCPKCGAKHSLRFINSHRIGEMRCGHCGYHCLTDAQTIEKVDEGYECLTCSWSLYEHEFEDSYPGYEMLEAARSHAKGCS